MYRPVWQMPLFEVQSSIRAAKQIKPVLLLFFIPSVVWILKVKNKIITILEKMCGIPYRYHFRQIISVTFSYYVWGWNFVRTIAKSGGGHCDRGA